MAELEYNELLVLNTILGYTKLDLKKDRTVSDLIKDIEANDLLGMMMSLEESREFVRAAKACIERNKSFGDYTITESLELEYDETGNRMVAPIVTFANGDDAVVVFWGTTGHDEWYDNVIAGHESLIGSKYQQRALEYLDKASEKYNNITVTGHSKGGNKAQFVTLMSDVVDRCVAFDGQGFSKAFIDAHADLINAKKDLITLISADYDIVNALLFTIAGTVKVVDTSLVPDEYLDGNFFFYHKPNILIAENGYLYKYEGVSAALLVKLVKNISEYMTSLEDVEIRGALFEFVATIVGMAMDYNADLDAVFDMLLNLDNTYEMSFLLSYIFEFAEQENLTYEETVAIIKDLGVNHELFDSWFMPVLWEMLFDASNSISPNEFVALCNSIAAWAKEKGLTSWDEFISYLGEDPIRIISLYASLDVESETVHKAIAKFLSPENIAYLLAEFAKNNPIIAGTTVVALSNPAIRVLVETIAGISAALGVVYLTANHIVQYWDEICAAVDKAIDYVNEKISEFYTRVKESIEKEIDNFISNVFELAEKIVTKGTQIVDSVIDGAVTVLDKVKEMSIVALKQLLLFTNPHLYSIVSQAHRNAQLSVYINLTKLKSCVNTLNRLATRITSMDERLDDLYWELAQNNIEQGEGIFTSLANLYNLFRADLNVDQGRTIKRKARALSDLYDEFENAEYTIKLILSELT